jgi:biotin synthase
MAGAGSIFAGDKLLTTPNPEFNEDKEMFEILGLVAKEAFADGEQPVSHPDPIIEARKAKEAQRAKELEEAKGKPRNADFNPRKVVIE